MWEFFEGPWNGDEAVRMYKGPMRRALERAYPDRSRFHILEDNDPSGFQSKKGVAAKNVNKISVFHIPPHSPDLNPCDFSLSLWKAVNRRMRSQEKAGPFDDVDNDGGVVCSSVDAARAARAQRRGP